MILLDDLSCNGSEPSLMNCHRKNNAQLFGSNCEHSEDAGVTCQCKW